MCGECLRCACIYKTYLYTFVCVCVMCSHNVINQVEVVYILLYCIYINVCLRHININQSKYITQYYFLINLYSIHSSFIKTDFITDIHLISSSNFPDICKSQWHY